MVVGFLIMLVLDKYNSARHYISVSVMLATTVTGLVYNFLLVPFAHAPMFFSSYVNFSTHVLVTVLALGNYFIFEIKGFLNRRHIIAGMVFPAIYWIVFVAIGERIDFFPYFFMNPNYVGWPMVFLWLGILLLVFGGLGFLLIWYDRSRRKLAFYIH